MKYIYKLKTNYIKSEEGVEIPIWGIEVSVVTGEVVAYVTGVFCDRARGEEFVGLCNSRSLDLLQLLDVLEDELSF